MQRALCWLLASHFFLCIYFISFHRWEHGVSNAVRRKKNRSEFSRELYALSTFIHENTYTLFGSIAISTILQWSCVAGIILVFGILSRTHTHTKFLRSNFFIWPSFICQTTSVIGRQIYISDWYRSYNKSDCWTLEVNLSGHPAHVGSIHIDGQTCVQYSCHMLHSIRAT